MSDKPPGVRDAGSAPGAWLAAGLFMRGRLDSGLGWFFREAQGYTHHHAVVAVGNQALVRSSNREMRSKKNVDYYLVFIGITAKDGRLPLACTSITGLSSAGIRLKVEASCPAMAILRR